MANGTLGGQSKIATPVGVRREQRPCRERVTLIGAMSPASGFNDFVVDPIRGLLYATIAGTSVRRWTYPGLVDLGAWVTSSGAWGIAQDTDNIYLQDSVAETIRQINKDTTAITTLFTGVTGARTLTYGTITAALDPPGGPVLFADYSTSPGTITRYPLFAGTTATIFTPTTAGIGITGSTGSWSGGQSLDGALWATTFGSPGLRLLVAMQADGSGLEFVQTQANNIGDRSDPIPRCHNTAWARTTGTDTPDVLEYRRLGGGSWQSSTVSLPTGADFGPAYTEPGGRRAWFVSRIGFASSQDLYEVSCCT